MNLRPDRERTATGYVWLDRLTDPYWRLTSWWMERKFYRAMAKPGVPWREARAAFQRVARRWEDEGRLP